MFGRQSRSDVMHDMWSHTILSPLPVPEEPLMYNLSDLVTGYVTIYFGNVRRKTRLRQEYLESL